MVSVLAAFFLHSVVPLHWWQPFFTNPAYSKRTPLSPSASSAPSSSSTKQSDPQAAHKTKPKPKARNTPSNSATTPSSSSRESRAGSRASNKNHGGDDDDDDDDDDGKQGVPEWYGLVRQAATGSLPAVLELLSVHHPLRFVSRGFLAWALMLALLSREPASPLIAAAIYYTFLGDRLDYHQGYKGYKGYTGYSEYLGYLSGLAGLSGFTGVGVRVDVMLARETVGFTPNSRCELLLMLGHTRVIMREMRCV